MGNRVLVVSKPHLECITEICNGLKVWKDNVLFRFTIGANDERVLSLWEPNAPTFEERLECLKHAKAGGFQTSVSVEPMLDSAHIGSLIKQLAPFVTETIWLGKMNQLRARIRINGSMPEKGILKIEQGQTDRKIRAIYEKFRRHSKIRWKDSIKEVIG